MTTAASRRHSAVRQNASSCNPFRVVLALTSNVIAEVRSVVYVAHEYLKHRSNSSLRESWFHVHKAPKYSKTPPIILIHGLYGKIQSFSVLSQNLITAGYKGSLFAINVEKNQLLGIEDEAKVVANIIQEILREHPYKKIRLVGHSKGGIVSAYLNEHPELLQGVEIDKIVTIAAPFAGSKLATLAHQVLGKKGFKELSFHTKPLQNLQEAMYKHPRKYHFIALEADQVVVPSGLQSFPSFALTTEQYRIFNNTAAVSKNNKLHHRDTNNSVISAAHHSILDHPDVAKQIVEWCRPATKRSST